MGFAFHQLCPRYGGTLTPTTPTAIRLCERIGRKKPQELTHFKSHPRHLVGKRTAQNKTPPQTSPATAGEQPFPIQVVIG